MDQSEYDRLYRKQGIIIGAEEVPEGTESQSITVDGQTVTPLRLNVINSSPQDRHAKEMQRLQENVQVVGHIEGGVDIIRRTGGADYAGNDSWRNLMRRCGRLKE